MITCPNCGQYHGNSACNVPNYIDGDIRQRLINIEKLLKEIKNKESEK